jgi:hypothetical protein
MHGTKICVPYIRVASVIVNLMGFYLTSVKHYIVRCWQVFVSIVSHVLTMHWTYRARPPLQAALFTPLLVPRGNTVLYVPQHLLDIPYRGLQMLEQ